ncbi:MAG: hypothetical protein M1818_003194 [Claussenomyces sp. TS43310]|nr:MAG: hypothetical protein M1818_003194 [Claussenomyces sp. TS43310]
MSTIASPRDTSVTGRRLPQISTPTSSNRPSIDSPRGLRSASASPNRGPAPQPRRNRAALREYYNLKREEQKTDDASSEYSINDHSDVQEGEMDREGFDGEAYVKHALETQSLEELLKTYNQVLTDVRALDAEKKALVYDNYSKLIAATETIRKMRANMDPLNPMTSTLDPAIAQIYERANAVKSELSHSIAPAQRAEAATGEAEKAAAAKRSRTQEVAIRVLETPERLRQLVAEGKEEKARREWARPLEMLERWRAAEQGGADVQDCIDDGEAALRGEPPNDKSWVNVKSRQ